MAEETQQSYTEQVTAEVEAVKPAGSPGLWPLFKLPRRTRADVLRKFRDLQAREDVFERFKGHEGDEQSVDMNDAADLYDVLADIEEILVAVAAPGADVAAWAAKASDEDIMHLFNWYAEQLQPGEAPASPTS